MKVWDIIAGRAVLCHEEWKNFKRRKLVTNSEHPEITIRHRFTVPCHPARAPQPVVPVFSPTLIFPDFVTARIVFCRNSVFALPVIPDKWRCFGLMTFVSLIP